LLVLGSLRLAVLERLRLRRHRLAMPDEAVATADGIGDLDDEVPTAGLGVDLVDPLRLVSFIRPPLRWSSHQPPTHQAVSIESSSPVVVERIV